MARKVDKTVKLCVICGDKAKGINFNALTCMSCKAFFRRNALRNKEMKCPFNDSCQVDKITRKFCSKCRLKKCFDCGMKKEWILSDEEKRLIKEKIMKNRLRRQQQEIECQQKQRAKSHLDHSAGQSTSSSQQQQPLLTNRVTPVHQTPLTGRRRSASVKSSTAAIVNSSLNKNSSNLRSTRASTMATQHSSMAFNVSNTSFGYNNQSLNTNHTFDSTQNSAHYSQFSPNNAYNFLTEPSAFSLDILLTSNECDPFNETNSSVASSTNSNGNNSSCTPYLDELLQSTNVLDANNADCAFKQDALIDPKKDDFLYSSCLTGENDEGLRLASSSITSFNDCLGFIFPNSIDSMDLFDNELENMDLSQTTSCSLGMYPKSSNTGTNTSTAPDNLELSLDCLALSSDIVEINKDFSAENDSHTGQNGESIEASKTAPLNRTDVNINKADFSQYLLHDNDPFTFQQVSNLVSDHRLSVNSITKTNDRTNVFVSTSGSSNSSHYNNNNSHSLIAAPKTCAYQASMNQYSTVGDNKYAPLTVVKKEITNSANIDYLTNYLNKTNEQIEDISNYDPIIEFVPRIADTALFREIGFSNRELILPERCLIKELCNACSILQNPYKRIIYITYNETPHQCRITEFFIHRLIRMSKRLSSFSGLVLNDQVQLLKRGLIEMLCLRSVLLYDPDRESWCFLDDKCKVTIMVNLDVIKPTCISYDFQRHKQFPRKFLNEWKTDNIIFDLLTAIILFTPRSETCENDKIKEENLRYTYLLRRYLEIKYPTISEAKTTFARLMACLDELRLLNQDITRFFVSISKLHSSPLFAELLDLHPSMPYSGNIYASADHPSTANTATTSASSTSDGSYCCGGGSDVSADLYTSLQQAHHQHGQSHHHHHHHATTNATANIQVCSTSSATSSGNTFSASNFSMYNNGPLGDTSVLNGVNANANASTYRECILNSVN